MDLFLELRFDVLTSFFPLYGVNWEIAMDFNIDKPGEDQKKKMQKDVKHRM